MDLEARVRTLAEHTGTAPAAVATLLAAAGELGTSDPHLAWADGGDPIAIATRWTSAAEPRLATELMQKRTLPLLRARHIAGWVAYESGPRHPKQLSTAAIFAADVDPAAELGALVPSGAVLPASPARMKLLWPLTGAPCDRFADRAHPPYGPNVWSFSGPIAASALPGAVAALGDACKLLSRHRALAATVATLGAPTRIGLDAACDTVWPLAWISASRLDADQATKLVAAGLGDAARAARVIAGFVAAGATRLTVALQIADEEPVRVRVIAPLEDA
jgi:hypothetical protein